MRGCIYFGLPWVGTQRWESCARVYFTIKAIPSEVYLLYGTCLASRLLSASEESYR